jgi:hypothetical protein
MSGLVNRRKGSVTSIGLQKGFAMVDKAINIVYFVSFLTLISVILGCFWEKDLYATIAMVLMTVMSILLFLIIIYQNYIYF